MTEIEEKLTQLAIARHQHEQLSQEAKALLEKFKSSEPYASKAEDAASAKALVEKLETDVRNWGIGQYEKTGEKKLNSLVEIRLFKKTSFQYVPQSAILWCKNNFTPALKLDTAKFEKAVEEGSVPGYVATCTVAEEPKVYISQDLSILLF